jgi:hypothetical protein
MSVAEVATVYSPSSGFVLEDFSFDDDFFGSSPREHVSPTDSELDDVLENLLRPHSPALNWLHFEVPAIDTCSAIPALASSLIPAVASSSIAAVSTPIAVVDLTSESDVIISAKMAWTTGSKRKRKHCKTCGGEGHNSRSPKFHPKNANNAH